MQTVLFHSTIFGPIHSRRLGTSLGVNLSPNDGKICSFDCLYCEAGLNAQGKGTTGFPSREQVRNDLEAKLRQMKDNGERLDVITFSGNGEPTLHPDFEGIMDDTIRLRDEYFPNVKISVLCNSTHLDSPQVVSALLKADQAIMKLDSGIEHTMRLIDRPNSPSFTVDKVVKQLKEFGKKAIIQTMFVKGEDPEGNRFDNTSNHEVEELIKVYKEIGPRQIMIYSIDRKTPVETLTKISGQELRTIAERIQKETGIEVSAAC